MAGKQNRAMLLRWANMRSGVAAAGRGRTAQTTNKMPHAAGTAFQQ